MSASILRLVPLPDREVSDMPTDDPTQPPRKIHRMNKRGTWTYPMHVDGWLQMLRLAAIARDHADEPFPFEAAVASYTLDADKGQVRCKSDYERQWGWTEKQLRKRWNEVVATAEEWSSAFGRLKKKGVEEGGEQRATEGRQEGEETADSETESQSKGDEGATEGRTEGEHTYQLPTPNDSDGGVNARAPADSSCLDPQIRPPTRDEVLTTTRMHGIDDELALDVFTSYAWVEWGGGNRLVREWPTAVLRSCRRIQTSRKSKPAATGPSNGKHRQPSPGKPQSDHQRRSDVANRSFDNEADWVEAFRSDPDPGDRDGPRDAD
jgi:hypothetical protein